MKKLFYKTIFILGVLGLLYITVTGILLFFVGNGSLFYFGWGIPLTMLISWAGEKINEQ